MFTWTSMQTHKIPNLRPRPPPFKIAHGPVAMGSVHREILVYACGVDHGFMVRASYSTISELRVCLPSPCPWQLLSAIRALPSFPGFPAHIHRERERERERERANSTWARKRANSAHRERYDRPIDYKREAAACGAGHFLRRLPIAPKW